MGIRRTSAMIIAASLCGAAAGAQGTPFLFTVMPSGGESGVAAHGYYEVGYGERRDPAEKDGRARLMIGPSLSVAPPAARWQLTVGGGPIIRASRSQFTSDASRPLPVGNGYVLRTAVGVKW